jgi:amidohydrolase
MTIANRVAPYLDELVAIRHDLHAHPELAFQEKRTAGVVAETLKRFGVDEVHTGIATTGVVGVVRGRPSGPGGGSNRAIGLRADMDALPIREANVFDHRSRVEGKMHACGHDGHTTMLLGAARYLAEHRDFDGTVHLIFQPAEEGGGGGRVMVDQGLFERFDCESVFGMHNMPGLPLGTISTRVGAVTAASDVFTIKVRGLGGHGAMPHVTRDPVLIASHIVTALQSIASRRVDPLHQAVVSVTRFHAGDAVNVIAEEAEIGGTARSFLPEVRALIETEVTRVSQSIAAAFDASADVRFRRGYPSTVNTQEETEIAATAARLTVGDDRVDAAVAPLMGSEDFSFMLNARKGCFVLLGNGLAGEPGGNMVHAPDYDFNDAAIPHGVGYWVSLVQTLLPRSPAN